MLDIIDAMLSCDGDFDVNANADVTCKQGLRLGYMVQSYAPA